ncbi:MAG TPA: hypothetical protein VK550_08015 [Polyangiaceae bacterium]|nr:hypothetical protein [Polyangiaceae bacterium]
MAGYGWSYLTVTHELGGDGWTGSDECTFLSEEEMLRELGATGWELLCLREVESRLTYYFKRPRA